MRQRWKAPMSKDETALPKLSAPARGAPVANFFMPLFWGTTDPVKVAAAAREIASLGTGGHHFADNLLTWNRNLSMLDDAPFIAAWHANIEARADEAIIWRRYVLA